MRKTFGVQPTPAFKLGIALAGVLALAVSSVHADSFGSSGNTFDIAFVNIGNPGNAADTTGSPNPAGSVAQAYRMGKFEISEQMIDKANTLGGLSITQNTRGADKPATFVSWNEAARFVNWLNTSSGSTAAYKFPLQPGEGGYSANANIELWTISDAGYDPNNLYRNSLARYFLPSVNEWYKAAFYDPANAVYYDYPTGSNSVPDGIDFSGDPNFDAVFSNGGANPQPNDITNVGLLSPYGTAGQGGNVYEWEETDYDLLNGPTISSSARGILGGSWLASSGILLASSRAFFNPSSGDFSIGFRVASIAGPSLPGVPGDYNGNGVVDAADYVLWRKGGPLQNEADNPATINAADYTAWRQRFGNPNPGSGSSLGGATAPEPATLVLLMFAAAGWCLRRCRAA